MQKNRGKLFILEGIDHVGKTTILSGLCDKLNRAGIPFSKYSLPGKEPDTLGNLVYHLHHSMGEYVNGMIDPISLQLLHIAAHIDTINSKILPDLKSGKIVLLDRSWWSTYAYGIANGISKRIIKKLIAPEIDVLNKVSIGKIFLIKRDIFESEYDIKKTNNILNIYEELKNKYETLDLVMEINNNNEVNIAINDVYNEILKNTDNKLVESQLELFNEYSKKKLTCNYFCSAPSLISSPIYDSYWEFAAKRQDIFFKRINKDEYPWTDDPILVKYKFTNAYRASDRVSQFLIGNVIYNKNNYSPEDIFFRIILFKLFNKIETWCSLEKFIGDITYESYSFESYDEFFTKLMERKEKIYSAAYIMPSGKSSFGYEKKHKNNFRLLESMMRDNITQKIAKVRSLKQLYQLFLSYPTIGKFLAFQYSIDINYSELCDFDEMSFVVAGPGAHSGIAKCFNSIGNYSAEDVIRFMAERQSEEFSRLKLNFKDIWGRPLQLIDCQNLFCETDKYARVAFPVQGEEGRKRIKQLFSPNFKTTINYFYPPKWGINTQINGR
ncbi:nucleotide kinase domain-containing protein [Desulfosporosinus fructosivorans]